MKSNLPIVVLQDKRNGQQAIKLTEEPFAGIIYCYGKVEFEVNEENDSLSLKFDYEIIDYAEKGLSDKKPFEKYIGKILEELIHEGIQENNLTYTGGVDENRTEDSKQSDT